MILNWRNLWLLSCVCLAACRPSEISRPPDEQPNAASPTTPSFEKVWQRFELIQEEMRAPSGPVARALILVAAQASLASFPDDGVDGGSFFSAQAWLVDQMSEVTVYVPYSVELAQDDLVDVVIGEHGYYFDSFVDSR